MASVPKRSRARQLLLPLLLVALTPAQAKRTHSNGAPHAFTKHVVHGMHAWFKPQHRRAAQSDCDYLCDNNEEFKDWCTCAVFRPDRGDGTCSLFANVPRSSCASYGAPAGYGDACDVSTAIVEREEAARQRTRAFALPRVALYTVVTGAYEKTVPYSCREVYGGGTPIAKSFAISCYFVTDSAEMADAASRQGWTTVVLRASKRPKRQQRKTKILGFDQTAGLAVLRTFEYVLYHDGHRGPRVHSLRYPSRVPYPEEAWGCWLHKMISETLQPLLEQRADIVYFGHPDRKTTGEEAMEIRKLGLCSNASLRTAAQLHSTSGYPDNMGLAETAVLARRWNSPTLQQAMHEWWGAMAQADCMRDQLNFEFALWKHKVKYVRREPPANSSQEHFPLVKMHKHSDPRGIRIRLNA
jgi:hypothetical protein